MAALLQDRSAAPAFGARVRSGVTLFELIVVLAIIVLIGAMIIPNVESAYNAYQVSAAADQVRAIWAMASSHAVEEGRPYRFAVRPGTGEFKVAPHSGTYWSQGTPDRAQDDEQAKPLVKEDQLPKGVAFVVSSGDEKPQTDANENTPTSSLRGASDSTWDTVAIFLPDGSADEDVEVQFQASGTKPTYLRLRALTGVVSTRSPIDKADR